jgi:hypothetical protein
VDEARVAEIAQEIMEERLATLDLTKRIEVALPNGEVRNVGRQHECVQQS